MRNRKQTPGGDVEVRDGSLKYTLIYAFVGAGWILASDTLVYRGGDAHLAAVVSVLKGLGYVVATSLLLYWMMRRNVAGLKAASAEIAAGEERFRGLFENAQEGVLVFDDGLRVSLANPRIAEMLGCLPAQLIGIAPTDLMSRDDADRFVAALGDEVGGYAKGEWLVQLEDGPAVWVLISATRFTASAQGAPSVMALLTDIGAQKAVEADIRDANLELERRVKERTRELETLNEELASFSYTVSHDLRAPLRAINGYGRAITEDYGDKLEPEAVEYLNRMVAASMRMSQLIDGLLDLSKASRVQMDSRKVNLSELAEASIADLRAEEPARDVEAVVQQALAAEGDPRLLHDLVDNLLRNAWKFSAQNPKARIEFGCSESTDERAFYVRDNGVGFEQDYADKLFKPFQRLHSGQDFPGEGIGLATVHRIVQRHGGRTWAEGREGQGATFWFTLGRIDA